MIPALKSEIRKIRTVRSTYVLLGLCLVLEIAFAFFHDGLNATTNGLHSSSYLANVVTQAITVLMLIISMVGVLLVTHEYRYSTIMYTLTAANKRRKVLAAKLLAVSLFAIVSSLVLGFLAPVMTDIAIHIQGHHLAHQTFPLWNLLWRVVFVGWAFSMMAAILAILIRIQIGAIVVVFLLPDTIEPLIAVIVKRTHDYLPFTSLNSIVSNGGSDVSMGHSVIVVTIYIIIGLTASWILFQRRDAN
jgi:ABC-2 type transport system permease protein